MQFFNPLFPSSALTDRSIYTLKSLFGINGWRPLVTSATVSFYKFNEIHAIVGQIPNWTEISMQFYHQRFPSSALIDRSIYTQKNLFRINGWGPLETSATVCVFNKIHKNEKASVYHEQLGIFYSFVSYLLKLMRIDCPFDLYTEKLVRN